MFLPTHIYAPLLLRPLESVGFIFGTVARFCCLNQLLRALGHETSLQDIQHTDTMDETAQRSFGLHLPHQGTLTTQWKKKTKHCTTLCNWLKKNALHSNVHKSFNVLNTGYSFITYSMIVHPPPLCGCISYSGTAFITDVWIDELW